VAITNLLLGNIGSTGSGDLVMPRTIMFLGAKADLIGGVWVSDEKISGVKVTKLLELFPLPDDFAYYPNRDFSWVNYLSEQFPKEVVVLENPPPKFDKNVIY
jgi:hypothetical protein